MLSWLFNWFRRRGVGVDYYHPGERKIYSFWDGQKRVYVDPTPLYIKVMENGPEIAADTKVATTPCGGTIAAQKSLDAKLRKIFDVKPLAEGGLTDAEVTDLLNHFLLWTERLKKNSPPSSSPASSIVPDCPAPMPPLSASGSTTNASGIASPAPSPMERVSPGAACPQD
jgi:hypothetical protein